MACRHKQTWQVYDWQDDQLEAMHDRQSDPEWVKRMLTGEYGPDVQRIQTYRLAVRQALRKRGLPVTLGS